MNLIGLLIQFLVFESVVALVFLTDFAESTGKVTYHPPPPVPQSQTHVKPKTKTDARVSDLLTWDLPGFLMDKSSIPTVLRSDAWHQQGL